MSDVEYWKDRYYEQQADFTESNGMLHQERDNAIKRAEKAECEAEALRDSLEAWEGTHCGGDCLAEPCATCDGTRTVEGKGARLEREVAELREALEEMLSANEEWLGNRAACERARAVLGAKPHAQGGSES